MYVRAIYIYASMHRRILVRVCLCLRGMYVLCFMLCAGVIFRSLQSVPLVTAASSKVDVVAALRSADAQHVMTAAEIMATQFNDKDDDALQPYAEAGAVAALVEAMATHGAHPGAQEQLCRAIGEQAALSGANKVWETSLRCL